MQTAVARDSAPVPGLDEADGDARRPERVYPVSRRDLPFVALALSSAALILYMGRSLTFWWDEWSFITSSPTALDYIRPHNEHWSTLPLALYRATLHTFGLRSYAPYLAEVMVLHVLAVTGAYVLMRRRTGPYMATALAALLLLLGSGSENLFWAFQTGFVGAVMFGVWALVIVETPGRWRLPIASVLLLAALMSSGIGLVFIVVFAVRLVVDGDLRSCALAVSVPVAAYLAWYLALGRGAAGDDELNSPSWVLRFVIRGLGYSTGEITGLGFSVGGRLLALVVLVAFAVATGRAVVAGRPRALAAGALIGLLTLYVLIGLVRESMDSATRSRYTYVAGFLVVLAVADWLPHLRTRWESIRNRRPAAVAIVALAFVVALGSNLVAFQDVRGEYEHRADATRGFISHSVGQQGAAPTDDYPPFVMPRVGPLLAALAKYGCPLDECGVLSGGRPSQTMPRMLWSPDSQGGPW